MMKRFATVAPVEMTEEQKAVESRREDYEYTKGTMQRVGDKWFCYLPIKLLLVDDRIQRADMCSAAKVKTLQDNWNPLKMDALKVSNHPEECQYSIIDGYHRYAVAKALGCKSLPCEIIDFGLEPDARLKAEAEVFASQGMCVERLNAQGRHKANLVLGKRENLLLDDLMHKYKVEMNNAGNEKAGKAILSGFNTALRVARQNPENLELVFEVINDAGWHIAPRGYSAKVIKSINVMLYYHNHDKQTVIDTLVSYFRNIEPSKYFADAMVAYPERVGTEALCMHLEDLLVSEGLQRVYFGEGKKIA